MQQSNLKEALTYIDPSVLSYSEWCAVGMALKQEGYSVSDWNSWSRRDPERYHSGECERKWDSFQGNAMPITGATILKMAMDSGYTPAGRGYVLGWEDEIGPGQENLIVPDPGWVEGKEVVEPSSWDPAKQLITYLETLFESTENVGYVTQCWENNEGKYVPTKGCWDRTAGQLIEELSRCKGDIGAVLGDYRPEVGAWIRFNPLDGQGIRNANVTDFRYALVESDSMDLDRQNALIRELDLPVACLVYSGKKSLHAIVRIEAANYEEYRKRVDYLYRICQKNGMEIDRQNKNPSRLSRMPGVMRNGHKQFLMDVNIGKKSWAEWQEWIEGIDDNLPDSENMAQLWGNLPDLSPPLIQGVLRQGHKMLLAGPSKAGKSYALIELCCAIAEGKSWLGFRCALGKTLYVNLELDRASCLHRFQDVYTALGWEPRHLENIDIWNLRGNSLPMDKLAPKLIRRAFKRRYLAVVIDPIYKVITGDENSADQMAHFCNQFDKICTELGCAVIYCHHHSKGLQGGKRSMDRASGSGVFARDPDAMLDLIELDMTDSLKKQEENKAACTCALSILQRDCPDCMDEISQDDQCSEKNLLEAARRLLSAKQYKDMLHQIEAAKKTAQAKTAWRIEGTLREFPKFAPLNLWFDYPVHKLDQTGALNDIQPEADTPPWKKNFPKKKSPEERRKDRANSIETAFDACSMGGESVPISYLADYTGTTEKTVRNRLKEHGGFWIDGGNVGRKRPKGREKVE